MSEYIKVNKNLNTDTLKIEHWFINEGEKVKKDQQIASIRADNRIFIIRAPFDGIFARKLVNNHEDFIIGQPLGELLTEEEAGELKVNNKLSKTDRKIIHSLHSENTNSRVKKAVHIKASPSARRVANEMNLNLEEILGTGPDGRIQLKDVNEYIIANNQRPSTKIFKNKVIKYNLPLTSLAKRLAEKNNLDTSKIPAPPNAKKIKLRDVERYLKNPETAEQELEKEYQIHPLSDLNNPLVSRPNILPASNFISLEEPEEEVKPIRLTTEEPSSQPTSGVIELPQESAEQLKLSSPVLQLLLQEPSLADAKIIRLGSTEGSKIPSDKVLELTQEETKPVLLLDSNKIYLLEPPKEEKKEQKVIRLPSKKPSKIESSETILLPHIKELEEISRREFDDLKEFIDKQLDSLQDNLRANVKSINPKPKKTPNIGHISTLVNLNLVDLIKKFNPPKEEIGLFSKNYILSTIYYVFDQFYKKDDKQIYYLSDIKNNFISSYSTYKMDEVKKQIVNNLSSKNIKDVKDENLVVVELLAYNLSDVSNLISSDSRMVLYLTYIKQFDKFFVNNTNIRSILKLSLDFDSNVLDPLVAINFLEALREELEKLEVHS